MKGQKITIRLIQLIFAIAILLHGFNWSKQWILISGLLLTFVPEIVSHLTAIYIPMGAQFAIALFIFASQYMGSHLGFYGLFHWLDMMLHILSGILIGYYLLIYLGHLAPLLLQDPRAYSVLIISFILAGAIAGAGLWEIWEFFGDLFFGLDAQLGSLRDTMVDIICGTIGGGLFAAYIGIQIGSRKNGIIGQLLNEHTAGMNQGSNGKNSRT